MSQRFRASALALVALAGCSQTPVTQPIRSLERSGDATFVCATPAGEGRPLEECPSVDAIDRRLLALVTQTRRGEVAVIDLSLGGVVDVSPATPGYGFLPVGAAPRAIVSTPGGVASFVGIAEPGLERIQALPTSCAFGPAPEITDFPACALPSAPGAMVVMVDGPDGDGLLRASCDGPRDAVVAEPGRAVAASGRACPADLALETVPPGRRKLVVALPALGEIVVLDAQELLDRPPGALEPCLPERVLRLEASLPATPVREVLPPDLEGAETCGVVGGASAPPGEYRPQPSGFALGGGKLYVSDLQAPVVHVLRASSPCDLEPEPSLLPARYSARDGTLTTTSAVAVSPLGVEGSRFVYAVDADDGSVMVFDVSTPGSPRTPLVRPGAVELPFEAPDRIAFSSRTRDLALVLRDVPVTDPDTGVAPFGSRCDPTPELPPEAPGALYRTSATYTRGAGPARLRGLFGFLALASGEVAVIDVEDFDAPCRRPARTSPTLQPDARGCADGALADRPAYFTTDRTQEGARTVSNEVSCRMVQAHRARAATYAVVDVNVGTRAPSLRSFPRLQSPEGAFLGADPREPRNRTHARLVAVPFPPVEGVPQPLEVWIGGTLYGGTTPLPETEHTLALRLVEPRAFAPTEDYTITYEGPFTGERASGLIRASGEFPDPVGFCGQGVMDVALARTEGERLGVAPENLDDFARRKADLVQLTGELLAETDAWWAAGGATCRGGGAEGRAACDLVFGTASDPQPAREFRILEAYDDRLVVEPRYPESEGGASLEFTACCFPARTSYLLRASEQWVVLGSSAGFRHAVERGPGDRCVRSCDPRRRLQQGRVFEVRSPAAGEMLPDDGACTPGGSAPPPVPAASSPCVFDGLTLRFAVLRGEAPSERGATFSFTVTGGWIPLVTGVSSSRSVLPQRLLWVPPLGQLAVVDGAAAGLSLLSLHTLSASSIFF